MSLGSPIPILTTTIFMLALQVIPANAKCEILGNASFRPIENDSRNIVASCDANGFTKQFKAGAGYTFTKVEIVRAPRNGSSSAHSFGFKYKPKSGFAGTDSVVVRVCANKDGKSGCSTLSYQFTIN